MEAKLAKSSLSGKTALSTCEYLKVNLPVHLLYDFNITLHRHKFNDNYLYCRDGTFEVNIMTRLAILL